MSRQEILAIIDHGACLDLLSRTVQHKSYSQTEGERALAGFMRDWGVVCGPGDRYNTMPNERVVLGDLMDAVRIYTLAILEICERA